MVQVGNVSRKSISLRVSAFIFNLMEIHIERVSKRFGALTALDDISLRVPQGQLVTLLGPSGAGKTTLLRVIAGLEAADVGNVTYGEMACSGNTAPGEDVPGKGSIGFVSQSYVLAPHLTVWENLAATLRARKWKRAAIEKRVTDLLYLIGLHGSARHHPGKLSEGQRQRVVLAQVLAPNPRVLLFDEPLFDEPCATGEHAKQDLRSWMRRLHEEIYTTSIFVTRSQEEAFTLANRVVVMNEGRIEQAGC